MMAKWIKWEEISLGRNFLIVNRHDFWNISMEISFHCSSKSFYYLFFNVLSSHTKKNPFLFVIFINWHFVYFLFVQFFMRWSLRTKLSFFFASSQKTKDEKSSIFSLAFFIISDIRYERKMRNIDLSKNKKQWIALLRVSIFEFSSTSSSVVDDLKNYKS